MLANVQECQLKSRKYPGNDFENRWVFSRWPNVDNDSTDVVDLSKGRSFHVYVRQQTGNELGYTRQHSYRKEDRAMRPIYGCPEKF